MAPLLVFAGFGALAAYRGREQRLDQEAVADAQRLSETLDRGLAGDIDAAQSLADSPSLDGPQSLRTFAEIARRDLARHPYWQSVLLLDPGGHVLLDTRTLKAGGNAVDPASIPPVLASKRPVVGNLMKGVERYALPVRAPVIRNGRVIQIVTIVVRPDGIARTLADARLPSDWITTVVDQAGRVVARSRNLQAFLGGPASANALQARRRHQSGVYDGYTLEHVDTISAFWNSPAYGWSVHIGIPRASFEAPLRRQLVFTIAGFIASVLLAGLFVTLLLRDLQLRRREAAAVEQSSRMEALGRLTGGVAHDFNNLLMIIQGNAEILQRRVSGQAAERPIAAIREATTRAAKLTRELLVFARGGQSEAALVELNATLADFLGAIAQAVGPRVEVHTDLEATSLPVEVDRVQLELAVLNLAVNARDAMVDGGVLTIATRRAGPDFVQLSVTDTGQGMSEEVKARAFDPFFTTKPQGVGTGLGLTQVYGFVRHAGGSIEVQSRAGRGTTMALKLPLAQGAPPAEADVETAEPADAPNFDGRRILVIDDNVEVRRLTVIYLREHGAEVVEGESGAEGLAELGRGGFHAVVSDIVMPGEIDGLTLAETGRERWPALPILLVSGYSASLAEAGARGFKVLRKPYDLAGLARLLDDLLAEAA